MSGTCKKTEKIYTDKQIIQIIFIQMQRVEAFKQVNREWKRKP